VDRLACVDLPALPLQLLLEQHPEWSGWPAAVVDEDKPQGLILWANAKAREAGVLPGLRYGPALSLAPGLRAGTMSEGAIAAGVETLTERLRAFSPDIEPSRREPGVFWLDAGGLEHLFVTPEAWAQAVRQDLAGAGYVAAVVVGFRRFGTYAAAKALRGRKAHVFDTPEREDAVMQKVALNLVGLPPGVRDALAKLGVHHVGEFIKLPAHGILRRFGPEAHELHRFASGDLELPLNPVPVEIVVEEHLELDYRETNSERLVFMVKPLVDRLLFAVGSRGQALTELQLKLMLEDAPEGQGCPSAAGAGRAGAAELLERIRTAEPTLSSVTVMELVKLRLTAAPLTAPVVGLAVTASTVPATPEQQRLFAEAPRRDMSAAARAFARLRAAFGTEDVVVKAMLRDRHSPEGSFAWEPLHTLSPPHPRPEVPAMLVRRILTRPEPLPHHPLRGPDGWLLRGEAYGPVERLLGPYRLSGGWWRAGMQRDYYFAEMRRGDLLWVYFDKTQHSWFLQGEFT
jgi:protein ImuB